MRFPSLQRQLWLLTWRVVPWLPALMTLGLIAALRVGVPYYDSWWFVQAFEDWQQGHYGLRELLATHGPHPTVPGKLIYWFAMQVTQGDVGWLPLLSWLFSLAVALGCRALLRAQFAGEMRTQWWLLLLANSLIFTTAMGSTWLWDFLFQLFIPDVCLVWALCCLSRPGGARSGILAAGALAVLATLSFGSGFTIAWLLLPLLWWRLKRENLSMKWLIGALGLALLLTWLSLVLLPSLNGARTHGGASGPAESFISRPWMTLKYVLILLGGPLGHGTSIDPEDLCMITGGVGVLVLMACLWQLWRHRRNMALLADAWPWLACCGFAVANALMITLARMGSTFVLALAPRYLVFTLFFPLGLVMLIATLVRRGKGYEGNRWLCPAVTAFLALQAINWADGAQAMRQFHYVLEQNRAALIFAKVLPLWPDRVIQHGGTDSVKRTAIPLAEQHRLHGVTMLNDTRLSNLRHTSPMSPGAAHIDMAGRNAAGKIIVQGVCAGIENLSAAPDLVLITALVPGQEERIIAFQFPTMPPDYFADDIRRRTFEEHYHGFHVVLDQAPVPGDAGTRLQAYAYFHKQGKICRIPGEFGVP